MFRGGRPAVFLVAFRRPNYNRTYTCKLLSDSIMLRSNNKLMAMAFAFGFPPLTVSVMQQQIDQYRKYSTSCEYATVVVL